MEIRCRLEFVYRSVEEAEKVLKSVEVDNYEFVKAERRGKAIISEIKAKTVPSLLHTLDDYLACVVLAEKVLETNEGERLVA